MRLHEITPRTLTRTFSVNRGSEARCNGIRCPGDPTFHHDCLQRLWGNAVWYCTCDTCGTHIDDRGRLIRDVYHYFLQPEASHPGSTICRDCANGVHH